MIKLIKKMYANIFGYFWLPCPICGEEFGGFDIGEGHIKDSDGRLWCCCKRCDFIAGQIDGLNNENVIMNSKGKKFLN